MTACCENRITDSTGCARGALPCLQTSPVQRQGSRAARPSFPVATIFFFALIAACATRPATDQAKLDISAYEAQYQNGNWVERGMAVREVIRHPSPASFALIEKAAHDSHAGVRKEALRGFRILKPRMALSTIMSMIENDPDYHVRLQALETLGHYRDPSSAIIFATSLKNEDWLIRETAIKSLLMIDDYSIRYVSIPYILQALDDPVESVKIASLENLKIRDARIYEKISDMFNETPHYRHSLLVAQIKALKGYRLDEDTRTRMVDYLTHRNLDVRIAALKTLQENTRIADNGK